MKLTMTGLVSVVLLAMYSLSSHAQAANNIVLVSNGVGAANNYPASALPATFLSWCAGCFPTVRLPLKDARTEIAQGHLYAWGQNVAINNGTFCFNEYVIWQLPSGEIHTVSDRGPCGTYLDKTLVPPVANPTATVVAGGGQGRIVSGTSHYANWVGTYATRVFVEDLSFLQFAYYDYLFVSISGASQPGQ
jgi:hypothetical protein